MPFTSADSSKTATTAGAVATEIGMDMSPRRQYVLVARTAALWFKVVVPGGTGAAVGGDGSHYLAPGMPPFPVAAIGKDKSATDGSANTSFRNRISIIRDGGTDASAILSEIPTVQPQ